MDQGQGVFTTVDQGQGGALWLLTAPQGVPVPRARSAVAPAAAKAEGGQAVAV